MTVIQQFFFGNIPRIGYKQIRSNGFQFNEPVINLIVQQPRRRETYTGQLFLPSMREVILFRNWPVRADYGQQAYNTHALSIGMRDYIGLGCLPSWLITLFSTDAPAKEELPELTVQDLEAQPLSVEEASWLRDAVQPERISQVVSHLLRSQQMSSERLVLEAPGEKEVYNMLELVLRLLPVPCRLLNWTTNRYAVDPPDHGYAAVLDASGKRYGVRLRSTAPLQALGLQIERELENLGPVHGKYLEVWLELEERLGPDLAHYYTPLELYADPETLLWLSQQYMAYKLYARAAKMLLRIEA